MWLFYVVICVQERDGYQKIVASYDSDITREVVPLSTDKTSQLEDMVSEYRKHSDHLEQQLREQEKLAIQQQQRITEVTITCDTSHVTRVM